MFQLLPEYSRIESERDLEWRHGEIYGIKIAKMSMTTSIRAKVRPTVLRKITLSTDTKMHVTET